jgi:VanZ family protein
VVVRRVSFALSVLVSLVVLFAPGSDVPGSPPGVDKLVHVGVFALLALTGRWAGLPRLPLAVALVVYGAVSEVVQAVAPIGRDGGLGDLAADAVGVLAVPALAAWRGRSARAAEVRRRG